MRVKYCKHCGKRLEGEQKHRSFCNWDCYQAYKNRHEIKIKGLERKIHYLKHEAERVERKFLLAWEETKSIKWLLARLLRVLLKLV